MAYLIYVENVLMPVTPSKITRKVPGKNEEIELLGGKTVLNLQEPGLTEWSMDFLLPKVKYPFVNIISDKQELRSQDFYLTHFNTLMAKAKPFDFMIIRTLIILSSCTVFNHLLPITRLSSTYYLTT